MTEGVIKEISVHTEVDIALTEGGTENTDINGFHYFEQRKTIFRSP